MLSSQEYLEIEGFVIRLSECRVDSLSCVQPEGGGLLTRRLRIDIDGLLRTIGIKLWKLIIY